MRWNLCSCVAKSCDTMADVRHGCKKCSSRRYVLRVVVIKGKMKKGGEGRGRGKCDVGCRMWDVGCGMWLIVRKGLIFERVRQSAKKSDSTGTTPKSPLKANQLHLIVSHKNNISGKTIQWLSWKAVNNGYWTFTKMLNFRILLWVQCELLSNSLILRTNSCNFHSLSVAKSLHTIHYNLTNIKYWTQQRIRKYKESWMFWLRICNPNLKSDIVGYYSLI